MPVNDGNWHFAVATIGPSGMQLYIDGNLAAYNTAYTTAQNFNGTWSSAPSGPACRRSPPRAATRSRPQPEQLRGTLGRIAVLPGQLYETQVQSLYADAGYSAPTSVCSTTATPYDEAVQALGPSAYWELAEQGGTVPTTRHRGAVGHGDRVGGRSDSSGAGTDQPVPASPRAAPSSARSRPPTRAAPGLQRQLDYLQTRHADLCGNVTQMAWVQLNAGSGGGIMGLPVARTTTSLRRPRRPRLLHGQANSSAYAVSSGPTTVTDGNWHLVVAETVTTGPDTGEFLYVDGNLVGYNATVNTITANNDDWQLGAINTATPTGCGAVCPASGSSTARCPGPPSCTRRSPSPSSATSTSWPRGRPRRPPTPASSTPSRAGWARRPA